MAEADTTLTAQAPRQPACRRRWRTCSSASRRFPCSRNLPPARRSRWRSPSSWGLLLWSKPADYAVLFSNLDERDGGTIVTTCSR